MRYDLYSKTVVITGASSGIGKCLAFKLIRDYSCKVIAIARNEERLLSCKAELQDLADNYTVFPFDASVRDNWLDLKNNLEKSDTHPDILINCAGILPKFSSRESLSDTENVFRVNFYSQVYSIDALLPLLKESKDGAIINFSSASALCPFGGVKGYSASKAAVENYTVSLASETKMYVCCVIPGFIKTDIMKNQNASERDARIFSYVCSDLDKSVNKMIRRIKRRRSRILIGLDARLMSFMYKLFPKKAPKLITKILKKTGLEIFKDI